MLQTEYDFKLPFGLPDGDGKLQRDGKMRMATAADELMPLRDPRVKDTPEYLIVIIVSRVILNIGAIREITPDVTERLFVQDLAYLQDLYNRINQTDSPVYEGACPECGKTVKIPINFQQAGR
jgi:hypothetical protein